MLFKTLSKITLTIVVIFAMSLMYACEDSSVFAPDSDEEILSQKTENQAIGNQEFGGVLISSANVLDQMDEEGNREVYAEDAATIRRTKNGISVKIDIPTPEPGTYNYPTPSATATDEAGPPEAFSLWIFVFDPAQESFGDNPWTGAFLGGGHIVGGPNLTLSGQISTQTDPFEVDGQPLGQRLENPKEAEIHLAVAPHGALNPDMLPGQIKTPSGPGPDIWWVALFD